MRVKLKISYDGTAYEGWQIQQGRNAPTVQSTLEQALENLFGEPIKVTGASRTDSGVHAIGQICHFDAPKDVSTFKDFVYSLQAHLPRDIVVKNAWVAPDDFESSRHAESKIYRYYIYNARRPSAIQKNHTYWLYRPLNLKYLNNCSKILEGFHDFKSFQNTGGSVQTTEREILKAHWYKASPHLIVFEIHGKGFLKQMVRNIVGTLLEMESQQRPFANLKSILEQKDRKAAGATAPPHALFLYRIYYPKNLDNECRKL